MVKNFAVAMLLLIVTSCVTTTGSSDSAESKYVAYFACVDLFATKGIVSGLSPSDATQNGHQKCAPQFKSYISSLLNSTKAKHGWSSLQPSVRPAVEKQVREKVFEVLINFYNEERTKS